MRITVLNYSKPEPELFDNLEYQLTGLRNQLMILKDNGYHSITCAQLLRFIHEDVDLPDKPVLITFDVGYAYSYQYTRRVLKELEFSAIFFIVGEWILKSSCREPGFAGEYMNIEQLRELQAEGFELGLHGYSRNEFNQMRFLDIEEDLQKNMAFFKKFDLPYARAFAYPKGFSMSRLNHKKEISNILNNCHIELAFQTTNKINRAYSIQKLEINSTEIDQQAPVDQFMKKVKGRRSLW